jgi:hypothetical protein
MGEALIVAGEGAFYPRGGVAACRRPAEIVERRDARAPAERLAMSPLASGVAPLRERLAVIQAFRDWVAVATRVADACVRA